MKASNLIDYLLNRLLKVPLMLQLLVFAVLITLVFITLANIKKMPPAQQRKAWWRLGTWVFLGVLIFLVITGRMHWVGALLGALVLFLRGLFGLLMPLLPYWLKRKTKETPAQSSTTAGNIQEALEILGLQGDFMRGDITADMVNEAHRHLIQKLHPDRGGNDYLASKINQARDLLIKELNKR